MQKSGFARCALALMLAGWASTSLAANNLECVGQGYSPEQSAQIDAYQAALNPPAPPSAERQTAMFGIINDRAAACADQHGWSPDAIEAAVLYQMTLVMRVGLLRNTPFTAAQMRRLDQAIAGADQQRLRAIISRTFDAALAGERRPEPSQADNQFVGRVFLRAGLPFSQRNAEYAGAYLAAVVGAQIYSDRFANR